MCMIQAILLAGHIIDNNDHSFLICNYLIVLVMQILLQMKPSNYESEKKNFSEPTATLSQTSESCPEGTIPIMRTRSNLRKKISLEENSVTGAMEVSNNLLVLET